MYGKVRSQEVNSPALREQSGPLTVNNTATITTKRRPYGRNIALVQIVLKNPRCARGLEKNGEYGGATTSFASPTHLRRFVSNSRLYRFSRREKLF